MARLKKARDKAIASVAQYTYRGRPVTPGSRAASRPVISMLNSVRLRWCAEDGTMHKGKKDARAHCTDNGPRLVRI